MTENNTDDTPTEATEVDEEIYVDYDITTYPSDNTLSVLKQMWADDDIDIPDFQRGFVWSIKQASLLVESFLRGLPVPPVFFFIDEENRNLVVDGQQRLMSILYYFEGYFGPPSKSGRRQVFKLTGLNEKSQYAGKAYHELSELQRRKFDNSVLRAVNIRQLSPNSDNSSIFHIFERLNTGGTPLSPQEIRNTVYRGLIVTKLREANVNNSWRLILGKTDIDRRERDVEILLRILGLFISGSSYETPMKKFLNNTMSTNRKTLTKKAQTFFDCFSDVCSYLIAELGERPFSPNGPLNVAVLDAIFTAVAARWPKKPEDFSKKLAVLLADPIFIDATSARTADTEIVKRRLAMSAKILA